MNATEALKKVEEWRDALLSISDLSLDCEMDPNEITARLDMRQQVVSRIQCLDAAVKSLTPCETVHWTQEERSLLHDLVEEGRKTAANIRATDTQLIEMATKKREEILGLLKKNSLSKGYLTSHREQKLRPAAIVDSNA